MNMLLKIVWLVQVIQAVALISIFVITKAAPNASPSYLRKLSKIQINYENCPFLKNEKLWERKGPLKSCNRPVRNLFSIDDDNEFYIHGLCTLLVKQMEFLCGVDSDVRSEPVKPKSLYRYIVKKNADPCPAKFKINTGTKLHLSSKLSDALEILTDNSKCAKYCSQKAYSSACKALIYMSYAFPHSSTLTLLKSDPADNNLKSNSTTSKLGESIGPSSLNLVKKISNTTNAASKISATHDTGVGVSNVVGKLADGKINPENKDSDVAKKSNDTSAVSSATLNKETAVKSMLDTAGESKDKDRSTNEKHLSSTKAKVSSMDFLKDLDHVTSAEKNVSRATMSNQTTLKTTKTTTSPTKENGPTKDNTSNNAMGESDHKAYVKKKDDETKKVGGESESKTDVKKKEDETKKVGGESEGKTDVKKKGDETKKVGGELEGKTDGKKKEGDETMAKPTKGNESDGSIKSTTLLATSKKVVDQTEKKANSELDAKVKSSSLLLPSPTPKSKKEDGDDIETKPKKTKVDESEPKPVTSTTSANLTSKKKVEELEVDAKKNSDKETETNVKSQSSTSTSSKKKPTTVVTTTKTTPPRRKDPSYIKPGKPDFKVPKGEVDNTRKQTDDLSDADTLANSSPNGRPKAVISKGRSKNLDTKKSFIYGKEDSSRSTHFLTFFVVAVFLFGGLYVIYVKKHKIVAFVVEGRRSSSGGRRSRRSSAGSSVGYQKLPTEDELPPVPVEKPPSVRDFIY